MNYHSNAMIRGVEDHQIDSCVDAFVESFRDLMMRHINAAKSTTANERSESVLVLDVLVDSLKDEVREIVDARIRELNITP